MFTRGTLGTHEMLRNDIAGLLALKQCLIELIINCGLIHRHPLKMSSILKININRGDQKKKGITKDVLQNAPIIIFNPLLG